MPKPVCVKCQTEFRPETIGVLVIETASFGPYKVWSADLWKCPGCGAEIVSGYSDQPIRQDHFAPDFPAWLEHEKSIAPRVIYDNERPSISAMQDVSSCACGARIEIPHAANCPNRQIPLPRKG